MNPTTILISDDHSIVRAGLRALLNGAGDILVVGEAENGLQAVRETKRLRPQVVLLDLAMPLLNGLEAARQIIREVPFTKVLVLSAYSDDQHVRAAALAGVAGYLVKQTAAEDLLQAVRETAGGNAFFSPCIGKRLLTKWRALVDEDESNLVPFPSLLTSRQSEVLQLIAEGYMTKQIADVLSIDGRTVEKHRKRIKERLAIHNIASLTRFAIASGVIESGRVPDTRWS